MDKTNPTRTIKPNGSIPLARSKKYKRTRIQKSKSSSFTCSDEQDVNLTQYRMMIGSLRYLCNSRPNLAFSVSMVSRFMERPNVSHLVAVKRILRYVKISIGCGILFSAMDTERKCNFLCFTDSNWCDNKDDQNSNAGYIFMSCETPISWHSKKEPVIALSSCEAEYNSILLCVCQAVWLMNLLKELGSEEGDIVTVLVDNFSAIKIAKNPIAHGRDKHIERRFHYLRELVSEGRLRFGYCRSENQVVDFLTKGVAIKVFKILKKNMSMKDLENLSKDGML